MTGSLAHILDIAGAHALLAGGDPAPGRDLSPGEIWLQRRHTGVDQQKTLIITRNKGKALHLQMILALEEFKEHSAELVNTVFFHFLFPPYYSVVPSPAHSVAAQDCTIFIISHDFSHRNIF